MTPELLFLHALPLDGSMWDAHRALAPSHAPTLYGFGDDLRAWAAGALAGTAARRLVVVGCSVGGSCALEVAALAPDRVAALVLIGTKASIRPDPAQHEAALKLLAEEGVDAAWEAHWRPLVAAPAAVDAVRAIALAQTAAELASGVTAFHTRPSRGEVLAAFAGPVAVVTGEHDVAPGVATCAAQAAAARRGRLYVVPDCGHYVPLERPVALARILADVLAQCA